MDLQLREETYRRFMESGMPFAVLIPVTASNQLLKVVVYDVGSDRVGSKLVKVK